MLNYSLTKILKHSLMSDHLEDWLSVGHILWTMCLVLIALSAVVFFFFPVANEAGDKTARPLAHFSRE